MYLLKKEYKSLSRQSRSFWLLLMAFLIPFAVFFMLFRFSAQLIQEQIEGSNKKRFKVAWVSEGNQADEIRKKLKLHLQIDLTDSLDEDEMADAVENDSISVGIVIGEDFDSAIAKREKAEITLYYKGGSKALGIVEKTIGNYRREISKKNLLEINLPEAVVNPIEVNERDMSSMQEMIDNISDLMNRSIAAMLSLLLLIFGAVGARNALKTVFWKEKENALNLLVRQAVIPTWKIYFSKIMIASVFSWKMMFLSLLGFAAALSFDQEGIMQGIMLQIRSLLGWNSLGLLIAAALPLSLLFTGFWGLFGFFFKKNTAGFLSNLFFVIILLLLIPTVSSSAVSDPYNAFIPFYNLIYLIKSMMSGEMSMNTAIMALTGILLWGLIFTFVNLLRFKRS